jgi:hypothetical protein
MKKISSLQKEASAVINAHLKTKNKKEVDKFWKNYFEN